MNKVRPQVIAIDFDGTCVQHQFPQIGKDVGAAPVLRRLQAAGHKLVLYTMRSQGPLAEAVKWFNENGIELAGVNCNPWQSWWTASPKVFADLYIEDSALGAPLCPPDEPGGRPFIDWQLVAQWLEATRYIEPESAAEQDIDEHIKNNAATQDTSGVPDQTAKPMTVVK